MFLAAGVSGDPSKHRAAKAKLQLSNGKTVHTAAASESHYVLGLNILKGQFWPDRMGFWHLVFVVFPVTASNFPFICVSSMLIYM